MFSSSGRCSALTWLGKVPVFWNALICCSGAVSQAASAAASAGCLLCFGTVRYEPPQLPPPPGNAAVTAHLPEFSGPACSLTTPSIQAGQTVVANAPVLNPLFHSGLNAVSLADWPAIAGRGDRVPVLLDLRVGLHRQRVVAG